MAPKTSPAKKEKTTFNILQHKLVSPHKILKEEEKKQMLKKFNISEVQLPSIKAKDAAVKAIDAKPGDVIEILRETPSGRSPYYRRVSA